MNISNTQILFGKPGTIHVNGEPIDSVGTINYSDTIPSENTSTSRQGFPKSFECKCQLGPDASLNLTRLFYGPQIKRLVSRMHTFYKHH